MIKDVPGVYQEWFIRGDPPQPCLNFEAVIVTAWMPRNVIASAWRVGADSEWQIMQAFFSEENMRPHPDADRVWADYCAAMLTR